MPIYVYGLKSDAHAAGCEKCRATFEIVQRMSEAPVSACPQCGAPVERRIQAPFVGDAGWLKGPSSKTLANAGFTQYKRQGKGHYEKTFGQGPRNLHPGSDSP